jgi:porin
VLADSKEGLSMKLQTMPIVSGITLAAMLAASAGGVQPEAGPESLPGPETSPESLVGVFESEAEMGPQNLPGREKGEREREVVTPPVPTPEAKPEAAISFWNATRLSGDWWGHRPKLEEAGVTFNGSFTLHTASVIDGGVRERASTRTLWDFNSTFDLEKLVGWTGASVFVDFQSSDERSVVADTGTFQYPSNIEYGRNIDEVGELWLQQKLWDGVVRLKAGKIDANSEFAFVNAAGDVSMVPASVSPTVLQIPTVPAQATGIVAFVYPTDGLYVGAGFFDGATQDGIRTGGRGPADFFSDSRSSSWYWIGEVGYGWDCESLGAGRAAAGGWHATGDFARFDSSIEEGTEGFYALAEQQVWRRGSDDANKNKGLFVYGQYGWADKDVTTLGQHVALGATLKGVCNGRPDDSIGVYWSMIDASKDVLTGANRDEHAFEAYYKAQITPWLYVQPSLGFFINPSGRSGIEDATVVGIQVGVTF